VRTQTTVTAASRVTFDPVFPTTKRPIITCHGHGGTAFGYVDPSFRAGPEMWANKGMKVHCDNYGNTWGNNAAQAILTTLYNTLGVSKVLLSGGSMGGLLALNWARANPTKVAGIELVIPLVNPEDLRANNLGGYQADFEAAYGGNPAWQALRPTHCPVEFAAQISHIPIYLFFSDNDPICRPATIEAFRAAHGNTKTKSLGSLGHGAWNADYELSTEHLRPVWR
jgi:pimeloyl-ACP methyl ester carboxylesterase